jgi:hypothetical protein
LPVQVEVNNFEPGGYDDRMGDYGDSSETYVVQGDLSVVASTEFDERFCMTVIGDVKDEYIPPTFPTPKSP